MLPSRQEQEKMELKRLVLHLNERDDEEQRLGAGQQNQQHDANRQAKLGDQAILFNKSRRRR